VKNHLLLLLLFAVFGLLALPGAQAMPMLGGWFGDGERSPAVAALLSLIPMPIALGQFYAGNWEGGLLFSFVETVEAATAVGVVVYEGGSMMGWGVPFKDWDATGQVVLVSAVGSFILTKFVDAFIAALSTEAHNTKQVAAKVSLAAGDHEVGLSFEYGY